jgi:hypothetical protein
MSQIQTHIYRLLKMVLKVKTMEASSRQAKQWEKEPAREGVRATERGR